MKLRFAMTLMLACLAFAAAAEVKISTELDTRRVVQGESFTLTLRVEGPLRGINAPELPDLNDFFLVGTSSSSNFSFINGQTRNEKIFHYNLIADQAGDFTIPAIPVTVKGQVYESDPIAVKVHPGGGAESSTPPTGGPEKAPDDAGTPDKEDSEVFIRSWADRDKVYVGEQLTHHFALYRDARVRFRGNPQYEAPETSGFWSEPLGDEISGFQKIRGRDFAVTELRSALFAHEPGRQQIGAAALRVTLYDPYRDDFFSMGRGRDKILRSEILDVDVLPLPEAGKPAKFTNTVARELELKAVVDKGPYEAGQPVTLTVTLTGYGNPRTFAMPELSLGDDFRDYDSDLKSKISVDENRIHVRKDFTWVLVPQRDGHLEIPELEYPWFDPVEARYRVARSKALPMDVMPASAEGTDPVVFTDLSPGKLETLGRSIHHIKTEPLLAGDGKRFPRSPAFWTALALPWPMLAGTWFWRRRRDAIASDSLGHRAKGAGKAARRHLKEAEGALGGGDFESFCEALARGLRGYLADRLGAIAAGLSDEAVESRLAEAGLAAELRTDVRGILSECDFARFAPGSRDEGRMRELLKRAQGVIDQLERVKGGRRGLLVGGALALMLLIVPAVAPAAGTAETDMAEAARLYEDGKFDDAALAWESLAEAGVEDSRLWYNLGNAYFQQDRPGPSILAYRRALRLAPRDREIRDNLEIVRTKRRESLNLDESGGLGRIWAWTRRSLSPGEMALMGLAAMWIATALALLGILRRLAWSRLRWPLILTALALVFLSIGAWRAEWEDWSGREGVLLAPKVAAQSGPGEDFITLFELHEGTEMRLLERRGDWIRVSLGAELEGWVPAAGLEKL